jgi:hypothetical protein
LTDDGREGGGRQQDDGDKEDIQICIYTSEKFAMERPAEDDGGDLQNLHDLPIKVA